MKLTSAALLAFLFVLGALCPPPAEASAVKVVIPVDPACNADGSAPEGFIPVSTDDSGASVTIDATTANAFEFINCTGPETATIDDLDVFINILAGSEQPITFDVAGVFDVVETGISTATQLQYELICDPSVGACTGLTPGEAGAAYVPEPSAAELLLLGIGSLSFLGSGRKRWNNIRPNWVCHGRLIAS